MSEPIIRTFSGKLINLLEPQPDHIVIDDIAHALSNICRFTGHTYFYSVAKHSILVSEYCSTENKLVGLMHDATEAYLGDVSSPLKKVLKDYKEIESNMWKTISQKFNLPIDIPEEVHNIDQALFEKEREALQYWRYNTGETPTSVRAEFLSLFHRLKT